MATCTSLDVKPSSYKNQPTERFSIVDISLQMFNGLNTTDIFVHSFENANPVDGASIEIIFKNNRELFKGISADGGRISVPNTLISGSGGFKPEFLIATFDRFGVNTFGLPELMQKPRFLSGSRIKWQPEVLHGLTNSIT